MAYIDIYDVASRMQQMTFSASSNPTITEVEGFISAVEAEMDARMNACGITTPVTVSAKVLILERIAVNGVVAEVLRAAELSPDEADRYEQLYQDGLKRIEANPSIIEETGETYAAPEAHIRRETPFRRGERQW